MTENTMKAGDDIAEHIGDFIALAKIVDGVAQDLDEAGELLEVSGDLAHGLRLDVYSALLKAYKATSDAVAHIYQLAAEVESYNRIKDETENKTS